MRKKALLLNFVAWELPEAIDELLLLLDLRVVFDLESRMHHIYQNPDIVPPRYPWTRRELKGGTQQEWSDFLQKITSGGWKT